MSHPPTNLRRLRTAVLLLLLAVTLPIVYVAGVTGAYYVRHRALAREVEAFPAAPAPTSRTRVMVFAPHCDDETLGCAGLMWQTLHAGGHVRVAFLTNGDGFRTAVERQARDMRIGPNDYIQFAALRQSEAYRALGNLGVARDDVLFLGYPDQGLMSLWNDNWLPDRPYLSRYTQCSRSPYTVTFDPNAVYCGHDAVDDAKRAMRSFRPTLVTVTHPAEDHPDHAAAAAIVARALDELRDDPRDSAWAAKTQLRYYLVHRGDWPVPQGSRPADALLPPAEMRRLDTLWTVLPLTPEETRVKAASIALYASQTALMGRFLSSFARSNELFGEIRPVKTATVKDGTMRVNGDAREWDALPPALLDPVRDNVIRDLQGGADIRDLYVCRDRRNIYFRLDARLPINPRALYLLTIRPFGADDRTGATDLSIPISGGDTRRLRDLGVRTAVNGRTIEASVPLALLNARTGGSVKSLAVMAETQISSVRIDRTGFRFIGM